MNKNHIIKIFDELEKKWKKLQEKKEFSKAGDLLNRYFWALYKTKGIIITRLSISASHSCIVISPDGRAVLARDWRDSINLYSFLHATETKEWLESSIKAVSEERKKLTRYEKKYNELVQEIIKGG